MKYSFFTVLFTILAFMENALAGSGGIPGVPEPSTLALFAGAGVSMFILKKLKK